MLFPALAVLLSALAGQGAARTAPDDLAAAKVLYASGAYEDALTRLSAVPAEDAADASQYRALCFLALGRSDDAKRALEDLAMRRPSYRMSDFDVSPQVISLYQDARRRVLPDAVKDLYARARVAYDNQDFRTSFGQFKEVLALLADPDLASGASAFADLKMQAEGFSTLSEAALAAPPAAPTGSAPTSSSTEPAGMRIYSAADRTVKPPVEIVRSMPNWKGPSPIDQRREHRGVLRVVIDERGLVESAALLEPILESYDAALLASTKAWRFTPATIDGHAVKYLKVISILLTR